MKNKRGPLDSNKAAVNIYSFEITLITYANICEIESRSQIYSVIKNEAKNAPTKTSPEPDGFSGEFYPPL